MSNRREFLKRVVAASGAATWLTSRSMAGEAGVDRSLRLLVLGGTGAMGPYLVRAAVARGHRVAVFSRGKRRAELPDAVERLTGDRNGDLEAIRGRDWDAVLDVPTFRPAWVRSIGEALGSRAGHYTFISTVSVYDKPAATGKTTEDRPVLEYKGIEDPYAVGDQAGAGFGALKVLCEREAERQFPGRTLVLRPGYVGGPGDRRALTYWAVRADKGGEMLAGGNPSAPVQYIDVRDLAEWTVRMIEKRATGIYNAVGPESPTTLAEVVDTARRVFAPKSSVTWVPASWLTGSEDPGMWGTVLFFEQGVGHIMRMSNARAIASGLRTRPLDATLRDALEWHRQLPEEQRSTLITGFRRKADGSFEPATSSWESYLEREKALIAAWRKRAAQTG